jgi:hypothetical protein
MASAGNPRRVLIIVENLPVPFDRRVWQEATTLLQAGYQVSIICPKAGLRTGTRGHRRIYIYRHALPIGHRGRLATP